MSVSRDWRRNVTATWASKAPFRARPFVSPTPLGKNPTLTGISRDSAGLALGNCIVNLFQTLGNGFVMGTTSDGAGNFTFVGITVSGPFFTVAYKAGVPDVAGTSVNTLTAA